MEQGNFLSSWTARDDRLTREAISRALAARPKRTVLSDAAVSQRLGQTTAPITRPSPSPLVPAAVLVPLVQRDEGMTVLLTQRTAHLAHHAGQISFPGGRIEAIDSDPIAAALRETEEEIGLPSDAIDVLGQLDDYVTGTGFKVIPVVGLIQPPFTLVPDSFEVEDIFEIPLAFVLDPDNHKRHSRVIPTGETRYFHAIPFGERYIWGATAAMLVNLYETLSP
jgi:8-oxo-dGTP pyrophosphatase MutT (NUDIX family)